MSKDSRSRELWNEGGDDGRISGVKDRNDRKWTKSL